MSNRTPGILVHPVPEASGPFENYALLIRPDGAVRMVHTEGVAYAVTEDSPWQWNDYSGSCPSWQRTELVALALCARTVPVDLADWVRTFGARLESNFAQIVHWYNS